MLVPDQIGRYHVQSPVGVGGFATVVRADDPTLQDTVAIKILAENWSEDPEIRRRFMEEARLLRHIDSPHLISVHDIGELADGRPYFVMEYANRGTLANRSAARVATGLDAVSARTIATVLAGGLGALHQAGIVHRDVNPRNLLLRDRTSGGDRDERVGAPTRVIGGLIAPDERLLIGDLGLAKNLVRAGPAASVIGGTPRYQAPEQIDPNGLVGPATDVFGSTAVFWEMLTGTPPPDPLEMDRAVLTVDEAWRPLFQSGMAADPDDRFEGMEPWLDAVLAVVGDEDLGIRGGVITSVDLRSRSPKSPYKGLAAFQPEDATRFFGRDALVAQLVERLTRSRVLVVGGPSGSGKSSLVRAGLIPAIATGALEGSERWPIALFTPRGDPVGELIHQLERAQRIATQLETTSMTTADVLEQPRRARTTAEIVTDATGGLLLIIDQFEELFTQSAHRVERQQFLDVLASIVDPADSKVRLVLVLRADFYGPSALFPWLADSISSNQLLVGPMQRPELRQAIEEPARQAGLGLEEGLVEAVLDDGADEPGALPLVSHAMEETWRRRKGSTLTLDGYRQAGGVAGAIAQTAEAVYGRFDPPEQDAARRLLLHLITPGEGASDTRRVLPRNELLNHGGSHLEEVADAMTAARLLTMDESTISIAHEALIHSWPRLHEWIDESREDLRMRQRIGRAAVEWNTQSRDSDLLYRGIPLQSALDWAADNPDHLGQLDRVFLDEGEAVHLRQEHEAVMAQRRSRWIRTMATSILAVLLAVSVVASVIAIRQSNEATKRFAASLATQAAALVEEHPRLALALAVEASARGADTYEARTTLVDGTRNLEAGILAPAASPIAVGDALSVAIDPDGSLLAVGRREGVVVLYDVATADPVGEPLLGHQGGVETVAFTPDGKALVTGDSAGLILSWDLTDPENVPAPAQIGDTGAIVWSVAIAPDGRTVATASQDGVVQLWDRIDLRPIGDPLLDLDGDMLTVAFDPDGGLLFAANGRGRLYGWSLADSRHMFEPFNAHFDDIWEIVFSPNGDWVATGSSDERVKIWTLTGDLIAEPFSGDTAVRGVQFLDDDRIVVGDATGRPRVWDIAADKEVFVSEIGHDGRVMKRSAASAGAALIATLGEDQRVMTWIPVPEGVSMVAHDEGAFGLAASPDGLWIATGDGAGNIRIMSSETGELLTGPIATELGAVWAVAYSPDGSQLIAGGAEGDLAVVDATTGDVELVLGAHSGRITAVLFDGEEIITGGADGVVQVWNRDLEPTGPEMLGHAGGVTDMALSRDGTLAVSAWSGFVHFWNPRTGSSVEEPLEADNNAIQGVAWSPDGVFLATASADEVVQVWDASSRRRLAELTPQPGGATDVGFLKASNILATTSKDGSVQLFDLTLFRRIGSTNSHSDAAWRLVVLPDGTRFVTSSEDGSVQIWDALDLDRACVRAGGVFDAEQRRRFLGVGEKAVGCL